jgi:hypothetical protein
MFGQVVEQFAIVFKVKEILAPSKLMAAVFQHDPGCKFGTILDRSDER